MSICSVCGVDDRTPSGNCRSCASRRAKKWRSANYDKHACTTRDYYNANTSHLRGLQLVRKFGITSAQYDAMLVSQDGKCAICRRENINKRLAVDHNHVTGKVRGLLCVRCNVWLGVYEKFKSDAEAYLKEKD
jgi:hypothetical protein